MKTSIRRLATAALAAVMVASCTAYPAYAQEAAVDVRPLAESNAGSFNVTNGTSGSEWTYDSAANTLTFNTGGNYTVTGNGVATTERIVVADDFEGTITIQNINIDVSATWNATAFEVRGTAKLTLMLAGENTLKSGHSSAGLQFSNATSGYVTIGASAESASLNAIGGDWGAGIGGGDSGSGNNITIDGGTITVAGGDWGAGIGGGNGGSGSNITINGGTITAIRGDYSSAGIGGGSGGSGNNIAINGGTIIANGGWHAAGIGGGSSGSANDITINGGTVTAFGHDSAAGIGGGHDGSGNGITITGGAVTANGGDQGSGIGGGHYGPGNGITITGGTVTANGGRWAAGIGGGCEGSADVTITGGTVTTTGGGDMYSGPGIGHGAFCADYVGITITGGSVKASSMSSTPLDRDGECVYLAKVDNLSGINAVTVDGDATFTRNGDHPDDGAFYLYLTGSDHELSTDAASYFAEWNGSNRFTVRESDQTPEGGSNSAPEITADDKTLTVGDAFDPTKGIRAFDKEDGDITDKIEVVSNNVDTTKAGSYKVTYRVTDSQGASATKTVTVTVKEQAGAQTPNAPSNGQNGATSNSDAAQTRLAKTGDTTSLLRLLALSACSAASIAVGALLRREER